MALTIGKSPLARSPGGNSTWRLGASLGHLLYLEDLEKRSRGQLAVPTEPVSQDERS
jgi:hypothetical protein